MLIQFVIIFVLSFFPKESFAQNITYLDYHPHFIISNNNYYNIELLQKTKLRPIISISKETWKFLSQLYKSLFFNQLLESNIINIAYNQFNNELQINQELNKIEKLKQKIVLQKQTIYLRSRIILIILILTLIIAIIIGILALRLRSTNILLEKLTKNRDKLFTIISHDLRSPLNSYQRYTEIVAYLIKTRQFDRLDEALKKIDEIGLNLAALLNNLLDWSLVKQIPTTAVINSQSFFNELLPIYRDMANLKSIELIEAFQDEKVKIDPHLLSLITRNLLDNAIKYTPEHNEVIIGTHRKGSDLILMVSNRENSMSNAQKQKISALFNNNYNYEFGEEGLGLGLILIKEFAQLNNVKITFYHSIDNLTIFEVRIPQVFV